MSSTAAAVKRKNMKHYSVGSIIWIIVEYASLIFFGFCDQFYAVSQIFYFYTARVFICRNGIITSREYNLISFVFKQGFEF